MELNDEIVVDTIATTVETIALSSDERRGAPSASKVESYALCPGKYYAEMGLTAPPSEDSERGTRIHSALDPTNDQGVWDLLDKKEQETALKCVRQAREIISDWDNSPNKRFLYEARLWWDIPNRASDFSGKADVLVMVGNKALVIDYKTGRDEAEESASNQQLRALAVLVKHNYPNIETVRVAIVQPLVKFTPEVCDYSSEDIEAAAAELFQLLRTINNPETPRFAGAKQCKYCAAKMHCQEARGKMVTLPPKINFELMSPEQMSVLMDQAEVAEEIASTIKKQGKTMLVNGVNIPNWGLKTSNGTREIKDFKRAFDVAREVLTEEEFYDCCSVSITTLSDKISEKLSLKGKKLDAKLKEMLGDNLSSKEKAPSLKRL